MWRYWNELPAKGQTGIVFGSWYTALLKEARRKSGLPLDFWADLTDGFDQSDIAILCGRSEIFPKYINSKDKP